MLRIRAETSLHRGRGVRIPAHTGAGTRTPKRSDSFADMQPFFLRCFSHKTVEVITRARRLRP